MMHGMVPALFCVSVLQEKVPQPDMRALMHDTNHVFCDLILETFLRGW